MNDEELMKISFELRRKIFNDIKEFWEKYPNLDKEKVLFLNSVAMSSILAQVTYMMFQKNIGSEIQKKYISQIAEFAQDQLENSLWMISNKIDIH